VFSRRLKDLLSLNPDFSRRDVELLKWGRHFRLSENAKVVVGRNQKENEVISSLRKKADTMFRVDSFPGPTVLATRNPSMEGIELAAAITVAYSDTPSDQSESVRVTRGCNDWSVLARKRGKSDFYRFMI
ncbi:MAG: tRNA 4-thiouridine(8) synthase ThiI, partial [Proteobacteria bacterium]|nr:tRNA 4-thiouridine(8) synthase ThiI [Pseudomonadota bacterium]